MEAQFHGKPFEQLTVEWWAIICFQNYRNSHRGKYSVHLRDNSVCRCGVDNNHFRESAILANHYKTIESSWKQATEVTIFLAMVHQRVLSSVEVLWMFGFRGMQLLTRSSTIWLMLGKQIFSLISFLVFTFP